MCLAPRYMNTSRWVPVLFFRNAASSSATPCAMAVVAISNSATKASGKRHLWLASSSRRVGEWKGMHVSGTGLGSASGAEIAAALSHQLQVERKSVGEGKSVSGRVESCGNRIFKQKKKRSQNIKIIE